MAGKKSVVTQVRSLIESEGLVCAELENGAHVKARVSNGKETRLFVFASTPSEWRGWLNKRAELRRFYKEARA